MNTQTQTHDPLIASDRVEGTAVYGADGEKLGSIARFMVDKVSGQAEYAVLSFGGLFGLGNNHYPLPWQALTYDEDKGGYAISLTHEQLENAPRYDAEGEEPVFDRSYATQVYGYYGVPLI